MKKTLYQYLGVEPTATSEAIRLEAQKLLGQYRSLEARDLHNPMVLSMLKEVKRVLLDVGQRQRYDQFLAQANPCLTGDYIKRSTDTVPDERPARGGVEEQIDEELPKMHLTEVSEENDKKLKETWWSLNQEIRSTIHKNIKTLKLEYLKTVYQDIYGNYFYDKWSDAVNYFIDNVLKKNDTIYLALARALETNREQALQRIQCESRGIYRGFYQGKPIAIITRDSLFEMVCAAVVASNRAKVSVNVDTDKMTPLAFEHFCADILRKNHWEARVTQASGDQGVDIVALYDEIKAVLQCKKYSKPVGNKAVQEIIAGKQFEQADIAAVVSNAQFTTSAKQIADAAGVYLLHYSELNQFAEKIGHQLIDDSLETSCNAREQNYFETSWLIETQYKDGVEITRIETHWYENGQKKWESHYKDGKNDGLETTWHENGQKQLETHYKNGKEDGLETFWYENGQKETEIHYKDGKKDGLQTYWDESGQKKWETHYKDGKEDGLETYWNKNGQKQSETQYKDGVEITKVETEWYENGQKQRETHYNDGKEEGLETYWNKNGQKLIETNYKAGKQDGLETEWHGTEQKERETHYKDGKKEGLETYWHENGQKQWETHYKDGKEDGLKTYWDENGQKLIETNYKNGKKSVTKKRI